MKKILVIEDNEDIRENLLEILELAGYTALSAENGKRGIEIAEQFLPDLILCDVMMPVLDGYGTLSILRKKIKTADIPFVFLTAKSEKNDFRYGMNLGADDYITKPFESNELLSVIELRLSKAEKIRQAADSGKGIHHFIDVAKGFEDLKTLADRHETRIFSKKSTIYIENTSPRYLYYIQRGKVKVFKVNNDGKEFILSVLVKNDFFGQLALLSENSYSDSATALEDCELRLVPKEEFFTLLNINRDVSGQFIKMLAGNVAEKEERLLNLAYNSVRKRVADVLMVLQHQNGAKPISMLREDIAALAGTAKETLTRTLSDFKEEKFIDIEEGRISIIKPDKLKNLRN